MNRIQKLSEAIESGQLKLQMGLSPETELDILTLRAMWRQLCLERTGSTPAEASGLEPPPRAV